MTARSRRRLVQAVVGFGILALFIAAALYLTSDAFRDRVRRKVVAEIESITGGRTEMRNFRWNLSKLEFEATDVTIHGLEAPGETPYAHVDRLLVRAKIISLFQREIGLRHLLAERPIIHLIAYPDGSTNQPVPKIKRESGRSPIDRLFDLAIDRLELRDGQVIYNDRAIPLDLSANQVVAGMTYSLLERRYDGSINVGAITTQVGDFRSFESRAEVRFTLAPDGAELKALKWASARSQAEASGRLTNYFNPLIELTYNASLDLAEAAMVARLPQLRRGRLDVNGSGKLGAGQVASAGRLTVTQLSWSGAGLQMAGVHGGAHFSLDAERVSISNLFVSAFGGAATGGAEIRGWRGERQTGSASVRLDNLQVARLAQAVSSRSLQLSKLNAVGRAGGTVKAQWAGSPANADVLLAIDITPPSQPAPEQLPVSGEVRATYRGRPGLLEVERLDLATRAARLHAAGTVGSETAQLDVALTATDLSEFEPALAAFGQPSLPARLHGRGAFAGTVSGKLASPTVAGHLEVTEFDTTVTVAAAGEAVQPPRTRQVHWDALRADLRYSPSLAEVRNGVLRRGSAVVSFSGAADLRAGGVDEHTPFRARLDVSDAMLEDVLSLAGLAYPVTGKLSLHAEASGTRVEPHGQGRLSLANGSIYGEPYKSLTANLVFAGQEVRLEDVTLAQNGARLTGAVAYNLKTTAFRFDLRGERVDLATVERLQSQRFKFAGVADFTASGSGTTQAPVINGRLHVSALALNGEPVGDVDAEATTRGADMQLTARSRFHDAAFTLDGTVHLRGDFPADLRLRFSDFDVDPLLRAYVKGRITGHSRIAGAVDLRGPLRRLRLLHVDGNLDQFSMEMERIRIAADGPIRFTMDNQVLRLERAHFVGDGTDLAAGGTLELSGDREIDLLAQGSVNLQLIQSLNPDIVSYGRTTLQMTVGGTLARPELRGDVRIEGGGVSFIDLPNGLSDINGRLVFNENRLQVRTLTAQSGGGHLEIRGFIAYANGISFNLTAHSEDIRLRYPPGVSAMANADLRLVGSLRDMLLSGDVVITKFGLNPRFDFALYLARSRQPPTLPDPDSPLNRLRLDVHITSTPELQVESSLAKLSGNVDLRLRGTGSRPVLLGRVTVLDGEISFSGTKYHVERGDVTFTNPVRTEPVLNIEASARVRDYDITLGFHGPVDKLSTTYRSDPPLPSEDIIALLALGRTREEGLYTQQTQPTLAESASSAILGQALESAVSSRVQRLFGVSRIKIDPQVAGPEGNPNARLTVEQQVSNKVTVTFITNLAQSAQQVIQVEYNVNRNFSILAVRDYNGVLSFDIRYRQRKR